MMFLIREGSLIGRWFLGHGVDIAEGGLGMSMGRRRRSGDGSGGRGRGNEAKGGWWSVIWGHLETSPTKRPI